MLVIACIVRVMRAAFFMTNLKEEAHRRVENYFQVLEDLEVEQVFELDVVPGLSYAVLCLLPQLVRDVVICKALAVVHDCLEEILDAKSEADGLHLELALRFRVTG